MKIFKKKIDWQEFGFSLGLYGIFISTFIYVDTNWWQFALTFLIWRLIDNSVSSLFERINKLEEMEKKDKDNCV